MVKIKKIKELILYFFIFVPFLPSFIPNIYTAPYALIVSIGIFLLMKKKTTPKELFILLILFLISLILLTNDFSFNTLRILTGYFSIFIIACSTFFICKINKKINKKLIYSFFLIWFVVGLIQLFIYPQIVASLVEHQKFTLDRGVPSLAPEPSYFGSVMLFFLIISYINDYNFKLTLFITTLSIVFVSSSMTGLFILCGFFVIYFFIFILKKNTFKIIVFLSLVLIIFYFNLDFFSGTRLHKLIFKILDSPIRTFAEDASANARIWHIIGSFVGSMENYFFPNPINNFDEITLRLLQKNLSYVHPYTIDSLTNKPMSGTGQMFFNLGIISLMYFYVIFRLTYKYSRSKAKAIFLTLCLFLLMTSAIPLSFPMFGFIYGLLAYQAYKNINENKTFKKNIN